MRAHADRPLYLPRARRVHLLRRGLRIASVALAVEAISRLQLRTALGRGGSEVDICPRKGGKSQRLGSRVG